MSALDRLTWAVCDWLASRPTFPALIGCFVLGAALMVGLFEVPR